MTLNKKIKNYLDENFPQFIVTSEITEGEDSETFVIQNKDKRLVLRINSSQKGFLKDQEAYEKFNSNTLRIPKVIKIDSIDNTCICISEYIEGKSFEKFGINRRTKYTPKLFELHLQLSKQKNIETFKKDSWKTHLLKAKNIESWKKLAKTTQFNLDIAKKLFNNIEEKIDFITESENLVHGDFGYDNVIITKDENFYLIDWEYATVGDPLFDIAWMQFWSFDIDYLAMYKTFARENNIDLQSFTERIELCLNYIALTTLKWYAQSGKKSGYKWIEEIIVERYLKTMI